MAASAHPGLSPFVWSPFGRVLPRQATEDGTSCASPSLCVLFAGNPQSTGTTIVHYSTHPIGGVSAWRSSYLIPYVVQSATCASPSLCVALVYTSNASLDGLAEPGIAYSTSPTAGPSSWHFTAIPPLPNSQDLISNAHIACASTNLCVAAITGAYSGTNEVLWSTDPTGGTRAWSMNALPGRFSILTGISCTAPSLCAILAPAPSPQVRLSTDPAGGPSTWTTTRVAVPGPPLTPRRMTITKAAITGVAAGHPKLTFTAARGANAPGMWGFYIQLPHGLKFPG
ncbi:MAG: hypothetical protein ACRDNK_23025, partial [Solirubrobacteraceae bacterium]